MLLHRAVQLHKETPRDKSKHAAQLHTKTSAEKARYRGNFIAAIMKHAALERMRMEMEMRLVGEA
jgi:hypothetical protein